MLWKRKNKAENALYGLIGYPLEHSFSRKYFSEKFAPEGIKAEYRNFPIEDISQLPDLIRANPDLRGLNVTIPHKQAVLRYLHLLDRTAKLVGSVNTIKIIPTSSDPRLVGYNTDVIGFSELLSQAIGSQHKPFALLLGNGGSAKALKYVLRERGIFFKSVSTKQQKAGQVTYDMISKALLEKFRLIINTTPLGMYPNVNAAPSVPFEYINESHILIDLIYNPEETLFLKQGRMQGAKTFNGLPMLYAQAEAAWKIWQQR
ncbi:MAG: shikimate dehydrogenase [Bacteroidetes bacterium]|nr:shikimate dehydrogenase [Bacteroidota bacterium]